MSHAAIPIGIKRHAQYCLLELARPGKTRIPVAVLLLDPASDQLAVQFRDDWESVASADDLEYLHALEQDFTRKAEELGGNAFLESLESSLSNFLRISDREAIIAGGVGQTLERLFKEHIAVPAARIPLYSLQAAAGKFGEDSEVEATGWVDAPPGLRLTEGMFAAKVVGRSMEPLIPDGSLCVFRTPVVGSRQGKRLLIEQFGATDSSARYTVKRYTSTKKQTGEDEWEHESIRLEPLNPEFEAFELGPEDFRVIAEFIQVLAQSAVELK